MKRKKNQSVIVMILTIVIMILGIRLYKISNTEIIDTSNFVDYFQEGESENGGLEITIESFSTFKKEYIFEKEKIKKNEIKKVEVIKYKIISGDTLSEIAEKHNITIDTIKINNKGVRTGKLKIGEELNLPNYNGFFYKIRRNDTLSKIAKYYGITVADIMKYNSINPKKLISGKSLFLYGVSYNKYIRIENSKQQIKKADVVSKNQNSSYSSKRLHFSFPVNYKGISSPFGNRFHPVLKRYILHTGVDLIAKYVPLRAAKEGIVTYVGNMNGYGKIIIIKHSNGYETRYAHLSVISTKVGEYVKEGELIGKTGASGRVTGPHLHFEIRRNGRPLNPMRYLS